MPETGPFFNEILHNEVNKDWLIISFIMIALSYVGVKLVFGRYWKRYRQAVFYSQEAKKLIHEKNVLLLQASVSLNILAALSMGLFFDLLIKDFNLIESFHGGFGAWMLFSLIMILYVGARYLLINILGRAADNINVALLINHQWLINFKNFGFFLLPFSFSSAFIISPVDRIALFLGLGVVVFMLVMNYLKAFYILYQHRISIYYGILYLCTLEILPFLIFWRVIRLLKI